MHNIQSPAHNIKVEAIGHAMSAIRACSQALMNERIFVDGEVDEYIPLEPAVIGGLHYAIEYLSDYVQLLSGAD